LFAIAAAIRLFVMDIGTAAKTVQRLV